MKKLLLVLVAIIISLNICVYNWCQQNNVTLTLKEIILFTNANDIYLATVNPD